MAGAPNKHCCKDDITGLLNMSGITRTWNDLAAHDLLPHLFAFQHSRGWGGLKLGPAAAAAAGCRQQPQQEGRAPTMRPVVLLSSMQASSRRQGSCHSTSSSRLSGDCGGSQMAILGSGPANEGGAGPVAVGAEGPAELLCTCCLVSSPACAEERNACVVRAADGLSIELPLFALCEGPAAPRVGVRVQVGGAHSCAVHAVGVSLVDIEARNKPRGLKQTGQICT